MIYIQKMRLNELYEALRGYHLITTVQKKLGVNRQQAIYYLHRLRKAGYVKTSRSPVDGTRLYHVARRHALGGTTHEDVIAKHTPIKLYSGEHVIHGGTPTIEETIVHAVKDGSARKVLGALWLFNKVDDWQQLYRLAKRAGILPHVAAVYDVARQATRVRRMPRRFRTLAQKSIRGPSMIGGGSHSKDFAAVQRAWKVSVPLNWKDIRSVVR